ncbi:unnamed protein product [marine sediment metagenome]|uniref:Fibronectin type-III domain-containing protein n=1 Tax=marine sediment metagenome TaxID=412755 RepID=X0VDK6_9ZZZZ
MVELALLRKDFRQARKYLQRGVDTFGYTPHAPYFCRALIRLDQFEGREEEASSIQEAMNRNLVLKPSSPSPRNRETGVPLDFVFNWGDCNAATSYDLFLWKVGEEEPEYPTSARLTESRTRPPEKIEPGTTYLWRVHSIGRYGEEKGEIWVFRTSQAKPIIFDNPADYR